MQDIDKLVGEKAVLQRKGVTSFAQREETRLSLQDIKRTHVYTCIGGTVTE